MNEREALLRAVCENPDDDTPRLVFADWLDENGEPERAEFIRLQCRREQEFASNRTAEGMFPRLTRELTLFERWGDRWLAELPSHDRVEFDWGGLFNRGFAGECLTINPPGMFKADAPRYDDGVDCSMLDWERFLWSAPITRLCFWDLRNWGDLFKRPEAVRLKSVVMYDCGVDEGTIDPLLHWAGKTSGRLILKQDPVVVDCGTQLSQAFGDRFEWTTIWAD